MTQQLDHTAAPLHTDPAAAPTAAVAMPRPAPPRSHPPVPPVPPPAGLGYGPVGGVPSLPPRRRSTGRVVAVVAGVLGAGAVLLVCLVLVLSSLFAVASPAPETPAVPSSPAPTSAPATPGTPATSGNPDPGGTVVPAGSPAGVRLLLAPAGKRLEAARATLGRDLTAASGRKNLADFRAAFVRFDRELADYRWFVASLPVPPGQEAAFASLTASVDAALADGHELEAVTRRSGLAAPAGRFDGHWSALVDAHNQLLHALATA